MRRIFVHIGLLLVFAFMPVLLLGQQPLAYPLDTIDGKIYYRYTVERSIGLYRLSVNFGVSQEEILRANPIIQEKGLRYDKVILIPAKGLEVKPAVVATPVPVVEPVEQPFVAPAPSAPSQPENDSLQPALEDKVKEKRKRRIILPQLKWERWGAKEEQVVPDTLVQAVDTLAADSVVKGNVLKVAFMLSLQADAVKRDKNMDRFYDFYAGALIAIYEAQAKGQALEIFTYDVGKSAHAITKVWPELRANEVDAVIGPVYSQQVALAADSAAKDSIPMLVPFLSRVEEIEQNPYVIKFNPSAQIEADTLARYLAERKDSIQCILLEAKESEVIPGGINALHQALKQHGVPTSTITLRAILTDSLENSFHPTKENVVVFNTEKFSNLNTVLPHLLNAYGKYKITLYSHYSWQNEKIILPQLYTSVFAKDPQPSDKYEELFRTYFNHELSSQLPRYDLLGYDLTGHLLHALINNDSDTITTVPNLANEKWEGAQSTILYQPVNDNGGLENHNVHIIHQ